MSKENFYFDDQSRQVVIRQVVIFGLSQIFFKKIENHILCVFMYV